MCLFDEEADSVRATAAALRHAQRLGLAICVGGYWVPTNRAQSMYSDLEARFMKEIEATDALYSDDNGLKRKHLASPGGRC